MNATETAQALFEADGLPFPPVPAALAAALKPQAKGWFATRPVASSPYDIDHFLAEVEARPGPEEEEQQIYDAVRDFRDGHA